jgi:signal transduction histidine kinase
VCFFFGQIGIDLDTVDKFRVGVIWGAGIGGIETFQNELIQSIINIVKNSVDAFSSSKEENKKITVLAIETQTHISLSIADNAGGINKDIIMKIFEPYFSTKSKNGTGLGLYMCKTIVEEHLKGKLTIVSYDDITEVLIELPYKINNKERI